ncbi:MAG: adenylyl-sulfate kinase [Rhodospirillaceae bacterium]
MCEQTGTVFWVTGLAGAGKTTIAKEFMSALQADGRRVVLLDGDHLREVFGETHDYSMENRRKLALTYGRLAKLIADQGFDVVCATISMFHECQRQNREIIDNYFEIYLNVPEDVLRQRNKKNLYADNAMTDRDDVVLPGALMQSPEFPDVTIVNDGAESPSQISHRIYSQWKALINL